MVSRHERRLRRRVGIVEIPVIGRLKRVHRSILQNARQREVRRSKQVPGLDFEVAIDEHRRQFFGKHIEGQHAREPQTGQDALAPVERAAAAAP